MKLQEGMHVWVSGDSAALGIEDYNVRVSSAGIVQSTPGPEDKKVLVTLDVIDNDHNVCVFMNKNAPGITVEMNKPRSVAETILQQLGGNRFIVMTGAKNFLSDGNTLRMQLPRNRSRANRLFITLDEGSDTYKMRFFRYSAPRFNTKTCTFTSEKVEEVDFVEGVYADALCDIFTAVTGFATSL